jgi:hypothetical protein
VKTERNPRVFFSEPRGSIEFEAFLDEGAMAAFDFSGTDGQMGLDCEQVIKLSGRLER